jgi:rod shape-determining protein MreD
MHNTSSMALTIFLSVVVAVALTMVSLPEWANSYRPAWIPLVLIYWTMALPKVIGIGTAWFLGLYMDAAQGTLLGQYALGYAVTAYISIRLHQQVRAHPLSQQALVVGLILLPSMSITLWVKGMQGQAPNTLLYWAPIFTSMLIWPWVYLVLRGLRRYASTNY